MFIVIFAAIKDNLIELEMLPNTLSTLFRTDNTNSLRGIAALGIFLFHILLAFKITPLFNLWGGLFVAMFLILGGYGINESYKKHGLSQYWSKRAQRVIIPTAIFIALYNFLYSEGSFDTFIHELLYIKPTFWFIFHICKCYLVYWIARRLFSGKNSLIFMALCSLICLNIHSSTYMHLEAEQSFSFFAGVLLSEYNSKIEQIQMKKAIRYAIGLFAIGLFFYIIKALPCIVEYRGTWIFNYLLMPFRITWGLAFILFISLIPHIQNKFFIWCGKHSLEIYIAHIPFIGIIADLHSTLSFLALSAVSFLSLIAFHKWIQPRLSLTCFIFTAVNGTFLLKYGERISDMAVWATLVGCMALCLIYPDFLPKYNPILRWKKTAAGIATLLLVLMLGIQLYLDPYAILVDRWSALHFPIQNMLHGIYPYIAQTHLGGYASPFPVWQILHIPFYLLGNVGLSHFAFLALYLYSIYRVSGLKPAMIVFSILMISPAVWYEASVRSDLMGNIFLLAAIINLSSIKLTQQWVKRHYLGIACAIALMASTRLLVLIPIGLLLLPYFITIGLRRQILMAVVFLLVFVLTFAPFALWDWEQFFYHEHNPWSLQTRQGSISDFVIFIPVALWLAFTHHMEYTQYYRNVAAMLIIFIMVSFFHRMSSSGDWNLFSSKYDITYLSTAIPFCLLSLSRKFTSRGDAIGQ